MYSIYIHTCRVVVLFFGSGEGVGGIGLALALGLGLVRYIVCLWVRVFVRV